MARTYRTIAAEATRLTEDHAWEPESCAWFMRSKEAHGALSNMTGGMSIRVLAKSGAVLLVHSSEHLYQCGRYPDSAEIQRAILSIPAAMPAKKKAWESVDQTRSDWKQVNVPWMLWVLRQKLGSNWQILGSALEATEDKAIVERSSRDAFWGAILRSDGLLYGRNVLGCLLMELRAWKRAGGTMEAAVNGPCPVPMTLLGEAV